MSENDENEWVPVVGKIVMDGLEERQTGRGSDGLVQGGVQVSNGRDQQGRDQQKGKREKELEERENMTAKDG